MALPPEVLDLADADAASGAKAHGLARLRAAGLPVPPAVVLTPAAFVATVGAVPTGLPIEQRGTTLGALAEAALHAEPTEALRDVVIAAATTLGPRVTVRSSLAIEDRAGGAAPGVGTTVVGIEAAAVWSAVRAVWSASLLPLVAAYADARGAVVTAPSVIVQHHVAGYRATIYTRPPGQPTAETAWIAGGPGAPARVPRTGDAWREALTLALAAEAALGLDDGADVELVWSFAQRAWRIVQARPIVHPIARPRRAPPPPIVLAALRTPARPWRRDVTHNPAPLSVAQAELCARVEAAAIAPFHLKVVAHHLYWAPRVDVPAVPAITDAATLAAELADREREIDAVLATPTPTLADALAVYLRAYALLAGELGPRVAAALAVLPAALAERGLPRHLTATLAPHRPSSIAAQLAACARGELDRDALLAAVGDAAPAWDVDAPTYREAPAIVDAAIARAALRPAPAPPPPTPPGLEAAVAIAAVAVDAAERDDLLYWRAQAIMRRALRAAAADRGLDPDDACWLSIDRLLDAAPLDAATAHGHAAAARAAAARAAQWALPLSLDDDAPVATDTHARTHTRFVGAGVGAIARGPIQRVVDTAPVAPGAIALATAVTPALAFALDGAAALISEHGSPLDHGAAMARELGIPCVVGCAGIADALDDGAWVTVDGDAGTVTLDGA